MATSVDLPPDEAALVHERIDVLGLPGIIDVHTHFMPREVLDKVWAYFDAVEERIGEPWSIAYRTDENTRVETLRSLGVRRFASLNYPHKPGMAQWLNDWSTGFADRHPDCLRSGTFYPEPEAGDYVAEALAGGVQIFKAHVQVGGYDPNDPQLDPVWQQLERSGRPVVIHAGHGPEPGRHTGADGIRTLLGRFPRLTLVVAHMGMPEYREFIELAMRHERVYLDTTMVFTAFTQRLHPFPGDLLADLERAGDRILFGSDFPNIPYPYVAAIDAILGLGLGDAWERGVLHDNAARLLHET